MQVIVNALLIGTGFDCPNAIPGSNEVGSGILGLYWLKKKRIVWVSASHVIFGVRCIPSPFFPLLD